MNFSTALMFLLTVLGIVFYYLHKKQEDDTEHKNSSQLSSSDQQSLHEEHGKRKDSSASPDNLCRKFSLAEIKLATNDFDDAFVIGKGGFGIVYKGTIDFFGKEIDVAIKRLNLDSSQGATEFRAEIEMLSKFRHSHIVSLLGYHEGSAKREMILVYEYVPNGSLEDHLHKIRANGSKYSLLTWVERLNICIGAARGLDYLHTGTSVQSRVIHRDIKSSNIFLDKNLAAKISDFGLSTISPANLVGTTHVYTNQIRGTFGYMDAEYFATRRLTRKSDVYAFGVILLEVLCGRPALDFTLDEQQHSLSLWAKQCIKAGKIDRIIDPCLRGQTRTKLLKEFGRIAYDCLLARSRDRPTMTMVLARLELVLASTLPSDRKDAGRGKFVDNTWSLLFTNVLSKLSYVLFGGCMSSPTKKLGQSISGKTDGIMMEKDTTTTDESGCQSGDVVPTSLEALLQKWQMKMPTLKIFTLSELQRATNNFLPDMCVGRGGFAMVYKGWVDSVTFVPQDAGDGLAIAVKRLKQKNTPDFKHWQVEVETLGTLSHPNLVKLVGYCWENTEFLLVYEYMQKGSLDKHLLRKDAKPLPWNTRIKVAKGVAQVLAFLHTTENNVIFRDVKTANILLDGEFNPKLSDFGLVKLGPVNGDSHISTCVTGSIRYLAPEYLNTGRLYVKSDVYAFGVVMLEIITGVRALDYNRPAQRRYLVEWARRSLTKGKHLQKFMDPRLEQVYPLQGAMEVAELIQNCLLFDFNHRPSMEQVVARLEEIYTIKYNQEI